jgi:hypothetical protein
MKGTPTEVIVLMHSMLPTDLIAVVEEKKKKFVKHDTILDSIGSTYLDWINHVSVIFIETNVFESYLDDIWYTQVPQDLLQLANDITFVNQDLTITYVGEGEDKCNILFTHNSGFHILIYITPSQFDTCGTMDVFTRAGRNIEILYDGLY